MAFEFGDDYRARLLALPEFLRRGRGSEGGASAGVRGGELEFREHRPYLPGDDLRRIDWNLFLRLDVLAMKEAERREIPYVQIILDRSGSMGPFGSAKDRQAREIAGGLGFSALRSGARLGLACLGGTGPESHGAFHGLRQRDAFLHAVESLAAPEGPTALAALTRLPLAPSHGRATFLVTDALVEPLPAAAFRALVQGAGAGTIVLLLSESERFLTFERGTLLRDAESPATIRVADAESLAAAYRRVLAAHEEEVVTLARRQGLRCAMVSDQEPFERSVLRVLTGGRATA